MLISALNPEPKTMEDRPKFPTEETVKTENGKETLKPEDIIEILDERIEIEGGNVPEICQQIGRAYIRRIVEIYHENGEGGHEKLKKLRKGVLEWREIKLTHRMEEKGIDFNITGFQAEAATVIALQEMNFTVFESTIEEDTLGKIDLWIDDGSTMIPVQVKGCSKIGSPVIIHDQSSAERLTHRNGINKLEYEKNMALQSIREMVKFLSQGNGKANEIKPLVIFIPSGENNPDAAFNTWTGLPGRNFTNQLRNEFFATVWEGEI